MELDLLKILFKSALKSAGKITPQEKAANDVSLFEHAGEFKGFIGDKIKGNFISIQEKSVDDVLKMKFTDEGELINTDVMESNGKISEKIIGAEEIKAYNDALKNEVKPEKAAKDDMFTAVFNELLKDDKFKKAIDVDKSGKIDEKEFQNFVGKIKGFDKKTEDVSVDDLLTAAAQIKNGVFDIPKAQADLTKKQQDSIKKDMKDRPVSNPQTLSSRSNVGGAPVPSGGYAAGVNCYNPQQSIKSASNMSESELEAELTKAKDDLSAKQTSLSAVIDGSDPQIKGLEENVNTTYDAYQAKVQEVDVDMAKQLDELKQKVDEKQNEINTKAGEIASKESSVSNAENTYDNAKSNTSNLEAILNDLNSQNSENNDLSSKINEVNSQITAAKQAEETAKQAVEKEKQELEKLKQEKTELETGEGGLNSLNEEMTQLEADIAAKHPEVEQAQKDWDTAKETLTTEKAAATEKAQGEVSTAQEKVNKLETELTNLKNNEAQNKYNNQYNSDIGSRIAQQAYNVPGTVGMCLSGVADTLDAIYGAGSFPPIMSAYEAADILASNEGFGSHFREIQVSRDQLPNLQAGAVVVWDNNANGGGSNVSDAGRVHGHISIALGNGMESSDHVQEQIVDRDATFRVFVPVN